MPVQSISVDVAVIGSGTAGLTAYRAARGHGRRVVMIEAGHYGTTCARVGCMPSKLLISAAEAAHMVQAAPAFGIHPGAVRVDGAAVMARVRSERDRFVGFVVEAVETIPAEDKLRGHARFTGPHTLMVGEHTEVQAARVVIATGSTPILVPTLAGVGERVITSDDVFDWTDLPASVAVIGTGVIGLELGQALARLGVRVSAYARGGRVAQLSDPQVLHAAAKALGAEFDLRFQYRVLGAVQDADGVLLRSIDADGAEHEDRYDVVLQTVGRSPNVGKLGLEHTGIALDDKGIPLFDPDTMQCGASHIFIAGDANNERPVLPEAADHGKIAGDNAGRYPDVRPGLRRCALTIAFTEPQIATIGKSYAALCAAGSHKFAVGQVSFENQGRSRVMLQNRGLLRVYGEYGTGRLLGAELAGPRAEHLAHLLAWACQMRMTVAQMLDMPFYHPVVEEGLRTALRDLSANIERGAPESSNEPDCMPGV
jgi:dihydrolipoamide dehydrogenase